MPLPVIIALFLCALLVTPAKSTAQDSQLQPTDDATSSHQDPKYYAIDRFMNITDDIWVWNTTQKDVKKCRKDRSLYMTANATYFNRSHEEDTEIIQKSLVGYFGNFDEDKPSTYNEIRITDGSDTYEEVLVYASPDKTCGVVKVFAYRYGTSWLPEIIDESVLWREVRVRGRPNDTSRLHYGCTKEFDEYVKILKRNWTSPYKKECI
uniref:Lipocalin n=1 Tax=Rhipicephalus zambeziensis TaxID=60191 RepID=A0A224YIC3_9ACAR